MPLNALLQRTFCETERKFHGLLNVHSAENGSSIAGVSTLRLVLPW